jgi:predicted PurR-regulated permease PerM
MDPRPESTSSRLEPLAEVAAPARDAGLTVPPAPPRGAVRRRPRGTGWSSGDVLRAAIILLGVYVVVQMVVLIQALLLTAFLGFLFGLAVARGADHLNRWHVPRGVAAGLIVLLFYAALYGAGAVAAPVLGRQFGALRSRLPEATDRVELWLAQHKGGLFAQALEDNGAPAAAAASAQPAAAQPTAGLPGAQRGRGARALQGAARGAAGATGPGAAPAPGAKGPPAAGLVPELPSQLRRTLAHQLGTASRFLFPFLSSTLEALGGILLITFIAIYFGIDPGTYRRGILHLVPIHGRRRADEVMTAIGNSLRRWLMVQFVAMVVIGVAVSVGLTLLGVEAAISLGIIAGVLEFVPTIGPILAALPAIAMGFLVSPQKALAVALVFTLLQQLEGNLLIPVLMKHGMELPPLLTILGQAALAVLFGFLGLVIAVPLLAAVMVAVKMLYVEDVVGDEMNDAVGSG